jgi:AcrR family transcriptional regulator
MSQKERIIETSINYFNENGFMTVSMRSIAAACNMSLSNLQYHFKTKEALINAIVDEMYKLFEGILDHKEKAVNLLLIINLAKFWFEFQKKYLFFYVEFSAILQRYTFVRKKYLFIKEKRTNEIESLLLAYAASGIMKTEPFANYYKSMADLLFFITNFHLSAHLSYGFKKLENSFEEANTLCYNLLMPSLTEQGLLSLNNIFSNELK